MPLPTLRLSRLLLPVIAAGLALSHVPSTRAGSVERIVPTADDLARELGIELTKFSAKFGTPVHCTARLSWKEKGQERGLQLEAFSGKPALEHVVTFSRKDLGLLQERTGSVTVKAARGLIDLGVSCGEGGFVYRIRNPFADLLPGQSVMSYVKKQSHEDLPLGVPVQVFLMTGPWTSAEANQDMAMDPHKAPAYIRLELVFSKDEPVRTGEAPTGSPTTPTPSGATDKPAAEEKKSP